MDFRSEIWIIIIIIIKCSIEARDYLRMKSSGKKKNVFNLKPSTARHDLHYYYHFAVVVVVSCLLLHEKSVNEWNAKWSSMEMEVARLDVIIHTPCCSVNTEYVKKLIRRKEVVHCVHTVYTHARMLFVEQCWKRVTHILINRCRHRRHSFMSFGRHLFFTLFTSASSKRSLKIPCVTLQTDRRHFFFFHFFDIFKF